MRHLNDFLFLKGNRPALRSGLMALCVLFSLQGCSVLPGMYVSPGTETQTREDRTSDSGVDYTLIRVTPAVIQEVRDGLKFDPNSISATEFKRTEQGSYPYRLGSQDVLRIFVWGHPDLTPVSTTVTTNNVASTPAGRTIDEKGELFFPLVGNVRASGLTVSQFRQVLTQRLSKYIKDPQVEVDVAGFRSQKIFITGQVKNPGVVPITDQPMYLTDAIGLVGGPTDNSDLYAVVLTRGKQSLTLDLDRMYYNGDLKINFLLQNGDVISVPDRQMRKVFVLGEVGNSVGANQARSYVMRRGAMTLTEVLSDAGGANPYSAAAAQIYVMRNEDKGKATVYHLDATQPQTLLMAEQFPIKPRDVIFVNPTGPTMIGRFIGQFLPLIQTVNTAASTPF